MSANLTASLFITFISIFFFILVKPAVSQLPSNWTKIPGSTEKSILDLAAFSSDTLFILEEGGKIAATFDGGNTWRDRNPQTGKELKFNAFRINERERTIIAVGDQNAVYRSKDMGESWELTFPGSADTPVSFLAITDDGTNYDKQVVYVAGEKGTLLKSVNDGVDWKKVNPTGGVDEDCNLVSFLSPDTGFVASQNGVLRTFDGGTSWKTVKKGEGIKSIKSRRKFKAGKALADVVKLVMNNDEGIQTSNDYGTNWIKDEFDNSCILSATAGIALNRDQCNDLHKGLLVKGGIDENKLYMLSGSTFQGVLQPKWENVDMENILIVMRTTHDDMVIAEALTDKMGRFSLDIPPTFSGNLKIAPMQPWDADFCPRPLPFDFDTTMEPMEECDESTLEISIIPTTPLNLNDITYMEDNWIVVGENGIVLTSSDTDADGDGLPELWSRQDSRTMKNMVTVTAFGIEKSDIRRGVFAAGDAGTIITTKNQEFRITSPANGDSLCTGSGITIHWTGGENNWNVYISVIDVNSWSAVAVVNTNTVNDGTETWSIPQNFSPGLYQIYIQEVNTATWTYGEVFEIVRCPDQSGCYFECDNNLLQNPDLNNNTVYGPMPLGSTANWTRSWYKTQIINGGTHGDSPDLGRMNCTTADTAVIGMWGNNAIGESIEQVLDVPFTPGKTYSISFSARWQPVLNRPYPVQFEFKASNASLTHPGDGILIGVSDSLTVPGQWVKLTLPDWNPPSASSMSGTYSVLTISPLNQSMAIHPDSTSYGQIGKICITEKTLTSTQPAHANSGMEFKLGNNLPNPFGTSTFIGYFTPHAEKISIRVYSLNGKEIKTLVDKVHHPGHHQVEWDGNGMPAGVYLYKMQAGKFTDTKKMILQ